MDFVIFPGVARYNELFSPPFARTPPADFLGIFETLENYCEFSALRETGKAKKA